MGVFANDGQLRSQGLVRAIRALTGTRLPPAGPQGDLAETAHTMLQMMIAVDEQPTSSRRLAIHRRKTGTADR